MLNKILAISSSVGAFLAVMFYFFFDRERSLRLIEERETKIKEAEDKAKKIAKEKSDAVIKEGPVATAINVADIIDGK
jgi:F0F1-type ATP synthase membrane subunit b/b'